MFSYVLYFVGIIKLYKKKYFNDVDFYHVHLLLCEVHLACEYIVG